MGDAPAKSRTRQARLAWLAVIVGVLLLGGAFALVLYLRSPQFKELVRQKVVTSLEEATGGRVDLQSFHWNLARLDFEATNLTVHGLEPSTAPPLAQVADCTPARSCRISVAEAR